MLTVKTRLLLLPGNETEGATYINFQQTMDYEKLARFKKAHLVLTKRDETILVPGSAVGLKFHKDHFKEQVRFHLKTTYKNV